ncbi:DUF637 domain-containing protein [Burkholderia multivorans]|uniref:DUF637 domain-containing protein n=2 Tax=Burkholderia multivorans TaxID=87883 RepID=UPI0022AA3A04|nr:DUF637 domain-containing protein [Burkholderia multivorans]
MAPTTTLEVRGLAMLADAGISAGLHTAIEGGSFGSALKTAEVQVAARAVKMPQMRLETPRGSWGKVAKRQSPTLSMAQYRVRRLLSRGSYRRCRSERQPDRGGWSGESEYPREVGAGASYLPNDRLSTRCVCRGLLR